MVFPSPQSKSVQKVFLLSWIPIKQILLPIIMRCLQIPKKFHCIVPLFVPDSHATQEAQTNDTCTTSNDDRGLLWPHKKGAGKDARVRQATHQWSQQCRSRLYPPQRRGTQAAHAYGGSPPDDKTRHSRKSRCDRVRSQPHGAHCSGSLHRWREEIFAGTGRDRKSTRLNS